MFHILKRYLKNLHLAKILLPCDSQSNEKESNILVEFNFGCEKLTAYLCSIKCKVHDISVNRQMAINDMKLNKFCLYDIVEIDWNDANFKLFLNNVEKCLPKIIYIP